MWWRVMLDWARTHKLWDCHQIRGPLEAAAAAVATAAGHGPKWRMAMLDCARAHKL
jgi:hypothetical protein